ncbi:hypothetical protein ACGFX4_09490 [Kitasatospora sp. NPDC048365]|uniref:hypothetical protein n=1 Tax=Kitasatospora sp. NPDC048365 TaxID=3364050 RepID=UPI0037179D01
MARAFATVRDLTSPRDLVLREANMQELRERLRTGELDIVPHPRRHRDAPLRTPRHRRRTRRPLEDASPNRSTATR